MKKLPIGIQSFEKLRKRDFLYVDKTKEIHQLITAGDIFFLSRPRRFGKSLLVSTLEEVFKGSKSLFEGLYIYDHWDWTQQHPVIRLDFGGIAHATAEELKISLNHFVNTTANAHSIALTGDLLPDKFGELIEKLHQTTGQRVVILIDEYDKPITSHLSRLEIANANRETLHDFYQVLKAVDEHLRFIFLTGVSKFSGVSVFSALNNLNDITLNEKYAAICGYTQQELEDYFTEYIDDVAQYLSMDRDELLRLTRIRYNGYSWDGKTPVYNPFSTLLFFDNRYFGNYWFRTGTPTFLIDLLKNGNQIDLVLNPIVADESYFDSYDPARIGAVPLLFQTGYLTIKHRKMIHGQAEYTLDLPNSEVRDALLKHLMNAYCDYPVGELQPLMTNMQRQVREADNAGLEQSMRRLFSYIPYNLHVQNEAYYHSMLLLWMKLMNFDIQGEVMTNIGRIDAVWRQPGLTVVAEIKYHAQKPIPELLTDAMNQIKDRRYYEQYLDNHVMLLAIAFTGKDVGCRMEKVQIK